MIKPAIKAVTPSNADQTVGAVGVLAFSADPAARWFYPNAHQCLTNFPSFVQAFAGKAFEYRSRGGWLLSPFFGASCCGNSKTVK